MLDKAPPNSIEAEMSVLGSILMDNSSLDTAREFVSANDFYREAHRCIFDAAVLLATRNEPVDITTLSEMLRKTGDLQKTGGVAYLAELVDYVPTSANIAYYARTVQSKAFERRVLDHARETVGMIYAQKPLHEVMDHISAITGSMPDKKAEPAKMPQIIADTLSNIENRYQNRGKLQGISYGIPALDKATNGLHRGDLIIVAGRPGMGKSAFSGNILETASKAGLHSLLFSLEMNKCDITERFVASHGSVKYHHIQSGYITNDEWPRITEAASRIDTWRLAIDDTPAMMLAEINIKAKRQKKQGLDLIVVDYLQLMPISNQKDSRTIALGEISRGLKQLAREVDAAVIAVSQLNRSVDSRPDKRPNMSDLRDSGQIEQDADVILFPFRPAVYCQHCKDRVQDATHDFEGHQMKAEIIIEKQRKGRSNISIPVAWLGEYQKFVELV